MESDLSNEMKSLFRRLASEGNDFFSFEGNALFLLKVTSLFSFEGNAPFLVEQNHVLKGFRTERLEVVIMKNAA